MRPAKEPGMRTYRFGGLVRAGAGAALLVAASGVGCSSGSDASDEPIEQSAAALGGEPICVTIQRGLSGSVADAHIADDKPTTSFGASAALSAGVAGPGMRQALLR